MKRKALFIMIFAALFLTACGSNPKTDWTKKEREEIYAVIEGYKDAVNEKNYETMLSKIDDQSPMRQFMEGEQYKESFKTGAIEKSIVSMDVYPIEKQYAKDLEKELGTDIENIVTVITVESIQTEKRLKQITGGYILKLTDNEWKIWSVESIAIDKDTASVNEAILIIKAAEIAHASTKEIPEGGWTYDELNEYMEQETEKDFVVTYDEEKEKYFISNHKASEIVTGDANSAVSLDELSQYK
ncbi:hypothetical protein CIB95_01130 [Lottiidibacillus patelloidae]|uniref:DUF5105 domain-containing protein n=1 Tax=Lottiidibacillus patelloidae TaxID=2670334 RepID=A0A263BY17_9BACI|nr:hypothetical protein CIB95_01130 [Lottiidibacillus patelloidae]